MKYLTISPEVQNALDSGVAVVALESTIISHGMPYPRNVETALKVEEIIREGGAIPATIAIIGGQLVVGCSHEQIDHLGRAGLSVTKVSRRDIPFVVAGGIDGATTVAATMYIASLAGIKVFATGGIGGVHRGAEHSMDISADLDELAQTNVMVVCAGAKSILDIALTLECLETRGVAVVGYNTDKLPAFYTKSSQFGVDYKCDTPLEIAKAFHCKEALNLGGGMLIANPIPDEYSMDEEYINSYIDKAVAECESLGIKGKQSTPFLLDAIQKATSGKSLDANIELVYNNARLATSIALELAQLSK